MPNPKIATVTEKTPGLQEASYLAQGRWIHNCCHETHTTCLQATLSQLISCSHHLLGFFLSPVEMPASCSFQDSQGSGVSFLGDTATRLLAFHPYAVLFQSKSAQGLHAFESCRISFDLLWNQRIPWVVFRHLYSCVKEKHGYHP